MATQANGNGRGVHLTVRLDAKLKRKIELAAARERRKVSDWVRLALEESTRRAT